MRTSFSKFALYFHHNLTFINVYNFKFLTSSKGMYIITYFFVTEFVYFIIMRLRNNLFKLFRKKWRNYQLQNTLKWLVKFHIRFLNLHLQGRWHIDPYSQRRFKNSVLKEWECHFLIKHTQHIKFYSSHT